MQSTVSQGSTVIAGQAEYHYVAKPADKVNLGGNTNYKEGIEGVLNLI